MSKLNPKAKQRLHEKTLIGHCIAETVRVSTELEVKQRLYGDKLQPLTRYVMRCYKCKSVVILCDSIPFSPMGLSPLKCNTCGKVQPMVENRRKYDPRLLVELEADIKAHTKEVVEGEAKS